MNTPTPEQQIDFLHTCLVTIVEDLAMPGRVLTNDESAAIGLLMAVQLASETGRLGELFALIQPWCQERTRKLIDAVQSAPCRIEDVAEPADYAAAQERWGHGRG